MKKLLQFASCAALAVLGACGGSGGGAGDTTLPPPQPPTITMSDLLPASSGTLQRATDAALDRDGSVVIADSGRRTIYRLTLAGQVSTVTTNVPEPYSLVFSPEGSLLVWDSYGTIRKVNESGTVQTLYSLPSLYSPNQVHGPGYLAFDARGTLHISDRDTVRKVAADGSLTTLAGQCVAIGYHSGDTICQRGEQKDGQGTEARFGLARAIHFDAQGNLLVADMKALRSVGANGAVRTLASSANNIASATQDSTGTIYLVGDNALRRLNADGTVTTLATAIGATDDALVKALPISGKRLVLVLTDRVKLVQLP